MTFTITRRKLTAAALSLFTLAALAAANALAAEDLADKQKAVAGVQRAESVLRYLGKQRHCDPKQGERRHHHGAQRGVPETAG